ncbi:MAG: hypothetical protein HQ478_05315 [Chloroflexi bacterium]|nr:hypothetical protein [Chloroflexota bacterium]
MSTAFTENQPGKSVVIALSGWVAVLALLLPVIGPMIDHHYAERLPGHGHVYFGSVELTHEHDLSASHSHAASTVFAVDDSGPSVFPAPAPSWGSKLVISFDRSNGDTPAAIDALSRNLGQRDEQGHAQHEVTPDPEPPKV